MSSLKNIRETIMLETKEMWDRTDILAYLPEFYELYSSRPIDDNTGGMKSAHMFNIWYILKKLKPKVIIESGVWMGQGTWFFEKACPESMIVCIDPNLNFRKYISPTAQYTTQDFLTIDWSKAIDTSESLVFFDDHQNSAHRLSHCNKHGFKHVVVEDNYPYNQGDCCSPKKILSQKEYVIDSNAVRTYYPPNKTEFEMVTNNVDYYQEMPPIFTDKKTRWGDSWNENYETPQPLLSGPEDEYKYPIFFQERFDYTWICYMQMNTKT